MRVCRVVHNIERRDHVVLGRQATRCIQLLKPHTVRNARRARVLSSVQDLGFERIVADGMGPRVCLGQFDEPAPDQRGNVAFAHRQPVVRFSSHAGSRRRPRCGQLLRYARREMLAGGSIRQRCREFCHHRACRGVLVTGLAATRLRLEQATEREVDLPQAGSVMRRQRGCERAAQRALGCLTLAESGQALPTEVFQSGRDAVAR